MKPITTTSERPCVVVFPDAPWSSTPFAAHLSSIAAKHPIRWVTNNPQRSLAGAPSQVTALSTDELQHIDWSQTTALVLHPCWAVTVLPLRPRLLGAWTVGSAGEDQLEASWRGRLAGEASFVMTLSEPYYLDLSFRRDNVFVWDGADETSDWFASQAGLWAADGTDPLPLCRLQRQRREAAYRERLSATGTNSTLMFYRSVYLYLLGDAVQAERELLHAFEHAVLQGEESALIAIYRFRSSLLASQGKLEAAVQAYEATASTSAERANAEELRRRLSLGEDALVAVMLLRLNDDYREAAVRLEKLLEESEEAVPGGEASAFDGRQTEDGAGGRVGERTEEKHIERDQQLMSMQADRTAASARRLLIDSLLQSGCVRRAYQWFGQSSSLSARDRADYELLQGTALLLNGRRREAILSFLRATEQRQDAIGALTELSMLDAAVQRLTDGGTATLR
ncbi:hypothetical protein PCCS19_11730 [Paenibacillus sp. CCS19]|uniref:hypothetical protein n=1 Tax=Paenibacillus sp. CCS19 TaxID=3158387 RepID=UPI002567FE9B|nr:hypothetical protein [Paenibacillus cellulosilyticus]GMK38119.1 hypothetical protein PCCS19_11730 [Paenibacillus cellulosilyticus]